MNALYTRFIEDVCSRTSIYNIVATLVGNVMTRYVGICMTKTHS